MCEPVSLESPGQRKIIERFWHYMDSWMRANTFVPPWLPARLHHPMFGYLVAVTLELMAVLLTLLLAASLHGFSMYGVLVVLAVVVMALYWGRGPSLVAILVGIVLLVFMVFLPQLSWSPAYRTNVVNLGLLLIVGILISLVAGQVALARRQADQARQVAEARAAELSTIFETLKVDVLVYGCGGHLVAHNTAAHAHLGMEQLPESVSWGQEKWAAHLNPRDAQGRPIPLEQTLSARALRGEVLTGALAHDEWLTTLDGREVVVNITGAPIRNQQGQITGAVLVGNDVTERRRLEQRTQQALNALIEMARAMVALPTERSALLDRVPPRLAELTREVLGQERVTLVSLDSENNTLHALVAAGLTSEQEACWRSLTEGASPDTWVGPEVSEPLNAGEVVQVDFTRTGLDLAPGGRRHLMAPLFVGQRLLGFLAVGRSDPQARFTTQETALLGAVAHLCALVLERERLLDERGKAHAHIVALEEARIRMDSFLNIASHELKTPLTSLRLAVELVKRQAERLVRFEPETSKLLCQSFPQLQEQYLKMMTDMPIGHPFRRPAVWGELPRPLLLAPFAKGRSYFCARCCNCRLHRRAGPFHHWHDTNCAQCACQKTPAFPFDLRGTLGPNHHQENWLCWCSFLLAG
jgi:GAF domain-containing protein